MAYYPENLWIIKNGIMFHNQDNNEKTISITRGLLKGREYIRCERPLKPEETSPSYDVLRYGDVFVVLDEKTGEGYKRGNQ